MLTQLVLLEKWFSLNGKKMTDQEGPVFPEKRETTIFVEVESIPKIGVGISRPSSPVTCRTLEASEVWTPGLELLRTRFLPLSQQINSKTKPPEKNTA